MDPIPFPNPKIANRTLSPCRNRRIGQAQLLLPMEASNMIPFPAETNELPPCPFKISGRWCVCR